MATHDCLVVALTNLDILEVIGGTRATIIASKYGNIERSCMAYPSLDNAITIASDNPNSRQAPNVAIGSELARINAARAVKPLPFVIPSLNMFVKPNASSAPARPQRRPLMERAIYCTLLTEIPAEADASGFNPIDRIFRPKDVLYRMMCVTITRIHDMYTITE